MIVATRDRPGPLRACLLALDLQRRELPSLEIVVVDDGSADAAAVEEVVSAIRGARLVRQAALGVGAARNHGVRAAQAELVCFTDDDCLPLPGWAGRLVSRLREGADAVAGPTRVPPHGDALATASQILAEALVDEDAARTGRTAFAPGSNFACRRTLLERFPLDERFAGIGAEDRDWCATLEEAGVTIAFVANAAVLHYPPLTWASFWRKNLGFGRGAFRFRRKHRARPLESPRFYARLARRGFAAGPTAGLAVCVAQVAVATGYVAAVATGLAGGVASVPSAPLRSSPRGPLER